MRLSNAVKKHIRGDEFDSHNLTQRIDGYLKENSDKLDLDADFFTAKTEDQRLNKALRAVVKEMDEMGMVVFDKKGFISSTLAML